MPVREGVSRRTFLATSATAAALAAFARSRAADDSSRSRPNILWLVSEDNSPFIGAYGDRLAHTPAIDAFAKQGVLYANAFSNSPVLSTHPDARVRLQALNALTFIGEPARAVLPIIERAIESAGDEYVRSAGRYLSFILRGTYTPSSPVYQGLGARK